MRYQCQKCNTEYEIEQSGQYQCQCGETFTIDTTQVTTQVTTQEAQCPFCKSAIPADARKCAHCGEWIKGKPKSKLVYCLLSLFLPTFMLGIPSFYIGKTITGIFLLIANTIFLVFIPKYSICGMITDLFFVFILNFSMFLVGLKQLSHS